MHMHACTCTCPFSPMHATLCQCKPNAHMCTLNEGHSWTYEGPFPYRSRKVKSLVFKTVLLQVREIGLQNLATDYKTNIFQHLCTCARALGHLCMLTPLGKPNAHAHVHVHSGTYACSLRSLDAKLLQKHLCFSDQSGHCVQTVSTIRSL